MDADAPPADAEHESLLAFVYLCPVGVLQIDERGQVAMMNPVAAQLLMTVADTPDIFNLFGTLERCAPDLRNMVASHRNHRGQICKNLRVFVGPPSDGSAGDPQVLSCTLIKIEPGCIMAMLDDITAQVAQERRLAQADAWMTAIFSGVRDFACFSLDAAGAINSWNASGFSQTGYTDEDVLGKTLELFRPEPDRLPGQIVEQLEVARREGWHLHEGLCAARGGRTFWSQILLAVVKDKAGRVTGYSVVLRDITERKMSADELRRLLTQDHLTGASNRAHFFEIAAAELVTAQRLGHPLSIVILDADHFKSVNDRYGHPAGDLVLKELVVRCRSVLHGNHVLARLGGEEFVIMLPGLDGDRAYGLAEQIRRAIADAPFALEDLSIAVTVSIGCATRARGLDRLDELLKAADVALYRAKQLGRNRSCIYRATLHDAVPTLAPSAVAAADPPMHAERAPQACQPVLGCY